MSNKREPLYICENCDKKTNTGYFDKKTGQVLCRNCFNERQREFKDQQIADLEAKLSESEKLKDDAFYNYAWLNQEFSDIKQKLKDNEDAYKILCYNHQNLGKAYNELEKQLAEKDKLIEFYINSGKEQCEEINKRNHRALNYCDTIDKQHQDKISFAVEKIKNLKLLILSNWRENDCNLFLGDIEKIIDNQIEELKKEMK